MVCKTSSCDLHWSFKCSFTVFEEVIFDKVSTSRNCVANRFSENQFLSMKNVVPIDSVKTVINVIFHRKKLTLIIAIILG
jgi:hypothetical protein